MTWSKKYESCTNCGKTDTKHMAKGLCARCYSEQYRKNPDHSDRVRGQKLEWLHKQEETYQKRKREDRNYGGKRDAILERDGYKCTKCAFSENLVVHHIDGSGRGCSNPNNEDSNLTTLCKKCHALVHRTMLINSRILHNVTTAFRHTRFDSCIECGRSDRIHGGRGLCATCYRRSVRMAVKI